jgi:type II secretory ATPase GspE/PulE/Tfp pilus assembly ATPase PilB-like protein
VVSRIKIMAELDIAERRIPQDGRFKVAIQGREVDFRVSVMPSIFGEDDDEERFKMQHRPRFRLQDQMASTARAATCARVRPSPPASHAP